MRASRTAPDGYVPAGSVVLEGNLRLKRLLNLASVPVLLVAGIVLIPLATVLRPELGAGSGGTIAGPGDALWFIGGILVAAVLLPVVILVVHEAVHGLLFWVYTRRRPQFGWKGWYAYACAPGWYLTRNSFLVVGLAPIVLMSAAALALAMVLPPIGAGMVLLGAIFNAAGSVGDLYICWRLLAAPASAVVEDRLDGVTWHVAAG
jgi:hypothetical protein